MDKSSTVMRLWFCTYYFRQGGYIFIGVCHLVSLFVSKQNYAKTTQPIFTKFGGKVAVEEETIKFWRQLCILRRTMKCYVFGADWIGPWRTDSGVTTMSVSRSDCVTTQSLDASVYKCLHDMAPPWTVPADPQHRRAPSTLVRSATRGDLDVPRCRLSTYGRLAFSCAGPAAWNSLPDRLKNSTCTLTIEQFRRLLK